MSSPFASSKESLVLCSNELNFEASSTNHHSQLSSRWIVPLMIRCVVSFLAYWRCSDPQCLLPGHQPSNPRPQLQPHDRRLRSGQPRQRARKFTVPAVNDVTGNRAADHDWGTGGGRTETETTFADFRLRLNKSWPPSCQRKFQPPRFSSRTSSLAGSSSEG